MNNPKTLKIFRNVITEIMEQFSFMFVDEEASAVKEPPCCDFIHAVMNYGGHAEGVLTLTAPCRLCRKLAANALGMDEDNVPMEAYPDALKELLNIVTGKFTHDLYGEEAVCDLAIPLAYKIGTEKWRELAADSECQQMIVEGYPMLAGLLLPSAR